MSVKELGLSERKEKREANRVHGSVLASFDDSGRLDLRNSLDLGMKTKAAREKSVTSLYC